MATPRDRQRNKAYTWAFGRDMEDILDADMQDQLDDFYFAEAEEAEDAAAEALDAFWTAEMEAAWQAEEDDDDIISKREYKILERCGFWAGTPEAERFTVAEAGANVRAAGLGYILDR